MMDRYPGTRAPVYLVNISWGWALLFVLAAISIAVIVMNVSSIRWSNLVWYQLGAGFALTGFGGMVAGWGIATFIASSKGIAPRASSYEIRPKAPPAADTSGSPNGPLPPPPGRPRLEPLLDDPLDLVSGIGPARARAAASVGFWNLRDVANASPDRLEELRREISNELVFKAVLLQANNARSAAAEIRRNK